MKRTRIISIVIVMIISLMGFNNVLAYERFHARWETHQTTYKWGSNISNLSTANMTNIYKEYCRAAFATTDSICGTTISYSASSENTVDVYYVTSSSLYGINNFVTSGYDGLTNTEIMYCFTARVNFGNEQTYNERVFKSAISHELCHTFGLADLYSGDSLMDVNRTRTSVYYPQEDEKTGISEIYGLSINSVNCKSLNESKNEYKMYVDYDKTISLDIYNMCDIADYIIVGKYEKFNKSWNMCRDINNIDNESTTDYVEGKLYDFTITEVLKGDIDEKEVIVNHHNLDRFTYEISGEKVMVNVYNSLNISPEIGGTYMLFLSKDNNFGNYYGATEPFMIKIENDKAVLQSNLINKEGDFVTTARASNGDNIQINVGGMKLEDTITGMTLDELKAVIK